MTAPQTAHDFRVKLTPEQQAIADAYQAQKIAEAAAEAPGDLFADDPPPPELDLSSLRVELGAQSLLGIPSEPPAPLLVGRIDPDGHTILFGDGGVGKGSLAAAWAVGCINAGMRVLVVDFENHPGEWSRRVLGLGGDEARERVIWVGPLAPTWTLKRGPIWENAERLRSLASAVKADVLIIDSMVMAGVGADPMDPAFATAYSAAIEMIGRPVLSLAHTTKAGDHRYPFGSIFHHNLARTTWSLKRDGERAILTHRKHNNYRGLGRYVVTTTWQDDQLREVWEQPYSAVLAERITDVLADGALSLEAIVARLNEAEEDTEPVKSDSVRKALTRGLADRFRLSGGRYGLSEK